MIENLGLWIGMTPEDTTTDALHAWKCVIVGVTIPGKYKAQVYDAEVYDAFLQKISIYIYLITRAYDCVHTGTDKLTIPLDLYQTNRSTKTNI